MGCCQTSTTSSNELVLFPSLENKFESDSCISALPLDNRSSEPPTRLYASDDIFLLYTISERISDLPFGERLICVHNPSDTQRELLLVHKRSIGSKMIERLLESCSRISRNEHEGVVKVFNIGEDEKNISIVTEYCGTLSLKDTVEGNRISLDRAVGYLKQLLKGVMFFHKLGVVLRHLACTDVFVVKGQLKISPIVLAKERSNTQAPEAEFDQKNDLWSLGMIFLQIIAGRTDISDTQLLFRKIESEFASLEDLEMLQQFFKPLPLRCGLLEVLNYQWRLRPDSKLSCNYLSQVEAELEEISEEPFAIEGQEDKIDSEDSSSEICFSSVRRNEVCEEVDNEYHTLEWSEVPNKVKICEILHDEIEEENSFSRMSSPEYPNPFEKLVSGPVSSYTLAESPVINDFDFKSSENLTYASPFLIEEQASQEILVEQSSDEKEISEIFDNNIEEQASQEISIEQNSQEIQLAAIINKELLIDEDMVQGEFDTGELNNEDNSKNIPGEVVQIEGILNEVNSEGRISSNFLSQESQRSSLQLSERRLTRSITCPRLMKRLTRVNIAEEQILKAATKGKLKFYSFKKRFGFVIDDEGSDVFLCEDELVFSGVKLTAIKNAIVKKRELRMEFTVVEYLKDGIKGKKAVDIKIIDR